VRIAVAAVALIGCLASATPPQVSESAPAGGIRISFYGFLLDTLRLGMNARVRLWAHSGVGAKLHLGVRLPPGFALVEGDTSRIADRMAQWVITIRPESPGTHVISGLAWTFPMVEGTDELEWVLALTVGQSVPGVVTKNVREERVKDGRRYRCGFRLVPIDSSEKFTESDIEREAVHGRPLDSAVVFDSSRSVREPKEIWLVVVIDRDGHVIEVHPSKLHPIDVHQLTRMLAPGQPASVGTQADTAIELAGMTAMQAVRRWHFEPTRMRGRPISDWVWVPVRVEPLP
jgi:hypothetical protein